MSRIDVINMEMNNISAQYAYQLDWEGVRPCSCHELGGDGGILRYFNKKSNS